MNSKRYLLSGLIALFLLFGLLAPQAAEARDIIITDGEASLYLNPFGTQPVTNDTTQTLQVMVDDVVNLTAYHLELIYDPADITVTAVRNGAVLTSPTEAGLYEPTNWQTGNDTGTIMFGMAQQGTGGDPTPVTLTEPGVLLEIDFTIDVQGDATMTLDAAKSLLVSWPDAFEIPFIVPTGQGSVAYNLDDVAPVMEAVTPAEGLVTLGLDDTFILTVDAFDLNLYELEIDHSFEGTLPEFSVYASEETPWGTQADKDMFDAAGVTISYTAADQKWTIDFGEAITDTYFIPNGVTFYMVLHDEADNKWGSMDPTTPENTYVYTFEVTNTLEAEITSAVTYEYTPPFDYTGSIDFDDINNIFTGTYSPAEFLANGAVYDLARYLGALYRQSTSTVASIVFNSVTYTWDTTGTLLGSNWEDASGNTLVSAMTVYYFSSSYDPAVGMTITLNDGWHTAQVTFKIIITDTLDAEIASAPSYVYDPVYTYVGDRVFDDAANLYTMTYSPAEFLAEGAMNDLARYLGALYRQSTSTIIKIEFDGVDYTWDTTGTLLGSNWEDASGNTLVSAMVTKYLAAPGDLTITVEDGVHTNTVTFRLLITNTLDAEIASAPSYVYDPVYTPVGTYAFEDATNIYTVTYDDVEFNPGAMNDLARYLGALYRQTGATVTSIVYGGVTYTWDETGTLLGSNWEDSSGNTLVSAVVAGIGSYDPAVGLIFTLSDGIHTENVTFKYVILDTTAPTIVSGVAIGATGFDPVTMVGTTFTVPQGYTVEKIEITLSEAVQIVAPGIVYFEGNPYGTMTATGSVVTITPYAGNETAGIPGTFDFTIDAGSITDLAGNALATLSATLVVEPSPIFNITDFGPWGETWPGAYNLGWGYVPLFDTTTIASIEVGMLDVDRNSIVTYTADGEQIVWQRENGYITATKLSSAPFYRVYNGNPIAEGEDLDWTVIFGEAFDAWSPRWGYVEVTDIHGTVVYHEIEYTGPLGDLTAPEVEEAVAVGADPFADITAVDLTFTVPQGYTVDHIEFTMSEAVTVVAGTEVTLAGVPYGTITANGSLITVTPYPGNTVANLTGTFIFDVPEGKIFDLSGNPLGTLSATMIVMPALEVTDADLYYGLDPAVIDQPLDGTFADGFVMELDPLVPWYYLDTEVITSNNDLAEGMYPFYLSPDTTTPIFYVKVDAAGVLSLIDGWKLANESVESPLRINGDFAPGTYTYTGELEDIYGSTAPLSITITFVNALEVTDADLYYGLDPAVIDQPLDGTFADGFVMELDPLVPWYYLDTDMITSNNTLADGRYTFYVSTDETTPVFYLDVLEGDFSLIDAYKWLVDGVISPLRINGDFTPGTYTYVGEVTDIYGSTAPLSIQITFVNALEVTDADLYYGTEPTAIDVALGGDFETGFVMELDPLEDWYYLDTEVITSNNELAEGMYPFYLSPDTTTPIFYVKVVGTTYTLIDGYLFAIDGTESPLRINGDFAPGTYTYTGELEDIYGSTAPLSIQITFVNALTVTDADLYYGLDPAVIDQPLDGTFADGFVMELDPLVPWYYLDTEVITSNNDLAEGMYPFYLSPDTTTPIFYVKVDAAGVLSLIDGWKLANESVESPLRINGDFAPGTYTYTGELEDIYGSTAPLSITITFVNALEVTDADLYYGLDPAVIDQPLDGTFADGFVMELDPLVPWYYLDTNVITSNNDLADGRYTFYESTDDTQPVFYLDVLEGDFSLIDAYKWLVDGVISPLRINGDFTPGTYTYVGEVTDIYGSTAPLSITITFVNALEVTDADLYYGLDPAVIDQPLDGTFADGFVMELDPLVPWYYLDTNVITSNNDLAEGMYPFYLSPDTTTPILYVKVDAAGVLSLIDGWKLANESVESPLRINGDFAPGTYTYTGELEDIYGSTAPLSITITFNDVPYATAQSVTVVEDTATAITLSGVDLFPGTLTYAVVTSPAHGTLSGTAPNLTYTPDADFHGTDSFTFTVSDGTLVSTPATVTITVTSVLDAPTVDSTNLPGPYMVGLEQEFQVTLTNPANGDTFTNVLARFRLEDILLSDIASFQYLETSVEPDVWMPLPLTQDGTGVVGDFGPAAGFPMAAPYSATSQFKVTFNTADTYPATIVLYDVAADPDVELDRYEADVVVMADFEVTDVVLTRSVDQTTWVNVPGNFTDGFAMPLLPSEDYYYFDVSTLTATRPLVDGSYPFYLTETPGTEFFAYWADKGVVEGATDWQGLMWDIINGEAPMFFLKVEGTNYSLIDGLQGEPNLLRINGDYYPGDYAFSGIVEDEYGFTDEVPVDILFNDIPVAEDQSVTTAEDTAVAITLVAEDIYPGTLSWSVVNPANGTLSGFAPSLTYTPDADFNGTDSFTFSVNDGTLGSNTATVTINVTSVNDAPVAVVDSYSTSFETLLTITAPGVLANDSDVDGDPLTAVLITDVNNGTLALAADGSFTYTPVAGFSGVDSFTYKANDGTLDSNIVTVTITVTAYVNTPPVAVDDTYETNQDVELVVAAPGVLDNDYDVDDDNLKVTLKTNVTKGTLALLEDGSFTYMSNPGFCGTDSFVYTLVSYPKINADGWTADATATITVYCDPIISSDDLDGPFYVGNLQEFHVRLQNPAPGHTYGSLAASVFVDDITLADFSSVEVQHPLTGTWVPLVPVTDGTGVRIDLGPITTIPLVSGFDQILTFRVNFNTSGSYPVMGTLYDGVIDPAKAIATYSDTMVVAGLEAEDFGYMYSSDVMGVTAGFANVNFDLSQATVIKVELFTGPDTAYDLLQTNTAISPAAMATWTQFSGPFDIFGTFDYVADGYWTNVREVEYGQTAIPSRVLATVTLPGGITLTAENTMLTGERGYIIDTLDEELASAPEYDYEPPYVPVGDIDFDLTSNTYTGTYTAPQVLAGDPMDDMARYLGALYRQPGSTITSIVYNGTTYTWDTTGTLLGSNWEDSTGKTLVSQVTEDFLAAVAAGTWDPDAGFVMTVHDDYDHSATVTFMLVILNTLDAEIGSAPSYIYDPVYTPVGTYTFEDATNIYTVTYDDTTFAPGAMNDLARYLGALYRQDGATVASIVYDGTTYTWQIIGDELKGSNWRDASGTTLVSVITAEALAGQIDPAVGITLTLSDVFHTEDVTFRFVINDTTSPVVSIIGATADGDAMAGNLEDGFILPTTNDPDIDHLLQINATVNEPLEDEYFGLYFVEGESTVTAAELKAYYDARGVPSEPLDFLGYLKGAADGINPFVFIKEDALSLSLVDAAKHALLGEDVDMTVPDDFPQGKYVVRGVVADPDGNETTVTLILIVQWTEETALEWLQANTVLSSVSMMVDDLTATFPPFIPATIVDQDYVIDSRMTLAAALPAGSTVTVFRDGVQILTDITLSGTGPFWFTELFDPDAPRADFDANYGGAIEEYEIVVTGPGGNPLDFNTTVLIESVISKDGFATETVLDDITLGILIPADELAALEWLQANTVLSSVSMMVDDLTATFPASIPPVIVAEDYVIDSRMTLASALPAGSTVTVFRDGVQILTDITLSGIGPFWFTELFDPDAPRADFDANYGGAVEEYEIVVTGPGGNPLDFNTTVLIESVISKDGFATETVLDDITLGILIPADELAALEWLQANTVLSSVSMMVDDLTATFPLSIPPVIVAEDYVIDSRMTLAEALPAGSTVTVFRGGVEVLTDITLSGTGPFWFTELFDPDAPRADFDANYGGAIEEYEIVVTGPGGNPLDFNTTVLIESVISKDGFATETVLDDITLGILIPADELAALEWLQANTVLSSVSMMVDDLTATFPASIPPVIVAEDYVIDSRMTLAAPLPAGSTVTVFRDGVQILTDITLSGTGPFWFTKLFDPDAPRADFDANYGGAIEEYEIVVTGPAGLAADFDTTVLIESVISKNGFTTETVLDDITLGIHLDDAVAPTIGSGVAKSAADGDVNLDDGKFTVNQGYVVDTIEITMNEPVLVELGTVVTMEGYGPYGTVTAHDGALITITPYSVNTVAALIGEFTFTVPTGSVTDLSGNPFTGSIGLVVLNVAPVAVADSYSVAEDGVLSVAARGVLSNDTDFDPAVLTAIKVTDPANGSLTLNADGSFTYTPAADFNGTDSFTYKANDGLIDSNVATVTITVTPVNDAPVAQDQSVTTPEDTALDITLVATDVDGNTLTYAIVAPPAHGMVTLVGNVATYTPAADYIGTDNFTFKANDGTVDSNVATVSITVTPLNDAPVAVDDQYEVDEDGFLSVEAPGVMANDTDVDLDNMVVTVVSTVSHGELVLYEDGSFTYTPEPDFYGLDSFVYQLVTYPAIQTGWTDEATVTITVHPINDAPVAEDQSVTTPEETAKAITLVATDIDDDPLTYAIVAQPAHGTVVLVDNVATYTPVADYTGPDSFTFKANDGTVDSNVATVSITVTPINDAPVAVDDEYTVAEKETLTIAAPGVLENDSDVDGDVLTANLVDGVTNGTLTLNADGSFTYTPDEYFNGTDSFTYLASDGTLQSELATVNITVTPVNDWPIANDDFYETMTSVLLDVAAPGVLENDVLLDPDEDVSIQILDAPLHGILSMNDDGSFTYTPDAGFMGTDTFRYQVNSVQLHAEWSDDALVTIVVKPYMHLFLPIIWR